MSHFFLMIGFPMYISSESYICEMESQLNKKTLGSPSSRDMCKEVVDPVEAVIGLSLGNRWDGRFSNASIANNHMDEVVIQ